MLFIWSLALYMFLFVVKQKTAYEMRISDWSSDVCSSDLRAPAFQAGYVGSIPITRSTTALASDRQCGKSARQRFQKRVRPEGTGREIGRASCRERECQYV